MNIWLRKETKPYERRTPLIPTHASLLIKKGYKVYVERSADRIYSDDKYEEAGCILVESESWPSASIDNYILGIKELPQVQDPISHTHIYFAHAFKKQLGADQILNRFKIGGGIILDYEYLVDCFERQVVAESFSYWAGYCGTAMALLVWDKKQKDDLLPFRFQRYYAQKKDLDDVLSAVTKSSRQPKVLVIGAKGKCGRGTISCLSQYNISADSWERHYTAGKGPFSEILNYDILINCIALTEKIPPFLTLDLLGKNKQLSVIADISCDASNPYNPLPIYNEVTTFINPTFRPQELSYPLDIIAIDHVASLLPKESSDTFSSLLLPHLFQLLASGPLIENSPWKKALNTFEENI